MAARLLRHIIKSWSTTSLRYASNIHTSSHSHTQCRLDYLIDTKRPVLCGVVFLWWPRPFGKVTMPSHTGIGQPKIIKSKTGEKCRLVSRFDVQVQEFLVCRHPLAAFAQHDVTCAGSNALAPVSLQRVYTMRRIASRAFLCQGKSPFPPFSLSLSLPRSSLLCPAQSLATTR